MPRTITAATLAASATLGVLALYAALAPSPAAALPIATGSQCNSTWVNNAGAMACFIQGEDEAHAGARHPHYVACLNGDVFCCVDNDHGDQDCVAQDTRGAQPTQATWQRAVLAAHRAMLTRLGRYTAPKVGTLQSKAPAAARKAPN